MKIRQRKSSNHFNSKIKSGTFFSPIARKESGSDPSFFPKNEVAEPMMLLCEKTRNVNANFDNTKIGDGVAATSGSYYGLYTEVKNLYLDVYRIVFEKSAQIKGIHLKVNLYNGTTIKAENETASTLTLKLRIPGTDQSWDLVAFMNCTYIKVGFGFGV